MVFTKCASNIPVGDSDKLVYHNHDNYTYIDAQLWPLVNLPECETLIMLFSSMVTVLHTITQQYKINALVSNTYHSQHT